jgi:alkanesulfonate monooxygenase SsuD/methylene tetrahydromethanopterin reductase-like flavin-dependent oxidoreductase (luciferase family)
MVTVDHISEGRVNFGIGTGWNEREHAALSIPFPSAGDRVGMLDEALQVIESLFTQKRTTFDGKYYKLVDAPFSPKPVQAHMPIMIGGQRPKMLKVIAKHADIWDSSPTLEELKERRADLERNCAEVGRDPSHIICSISFGADRIEDEAGFADLIRSYYEGGARQFLFDFPISDSGIASAERVSKSTILRLREELAGA